MITSKVAAITRAKEIIRQNKMEAEQRAEVNLNRALADKSFNKNYSRLMDLTWEIGKAEYQKTDTKKLYEEYNQLENANNKILAKLGLSPEELKPQYSCKKCNDTGILKNQECSCFKTALSNELLQGSGITDNNSFKSADMAIWDKETKDKNATLYKKMKEYSADLANTNKKLLTICGKTGVGKTFLAQCMVNESISHGNYTIFISAFELNQQFLAYHCSDVSEKALILEPFLACDFLVIDDLGTENILKNVTREYLYLLLTERLANNKNTLITTNLLLNDIDTVYDGRISSRITDKRNSAVLEMDGSDLRHKKD